MRSVVLIDVLVHVRRKKKASPSRKLTFTYLYLSFVLYSPNLDSWYEKLYYIIWAINIKDNVMNINHKLQTNICLSARHAVWLLPNPWLKLLKPSRSKFSCESTCKWREHIRQLIHFQLTLNRFGGAICILILTA